MNKIVLFVLGMFVYVSSIFALDIANGKVDFIVDAQTFLEQDRGGTGDWGLGFARENIEAGFRYDVVYGEDKYFYTATVTNPYSDSKLQVGDMMFGWNNGNHTFKFGQGTFPMGIIMSNYHFNLRNSLRAPMTMQVFNNNIVGEYSDGLNYIYSNSMENYDYQLKFFMIQEQFYDKKTYGENPRESLVPAFSLVLNNNIFEIHASYANKANDLVMKMLGIGFTLPKDVRFQVEFLDYKLNKSGFSVDVTPDASVFNIPSNMDLYLDNIDYKVYQFVLEKDLEVNSKLLTIYGQYYISETTLDYYSIFSNGFALRTADQHYNYGNNYHWTVGANYHVTNEISFITEFNQNGIDTLTNYKYRWDTGVRIRF